MDANFTYITTIFPVVHLSWCDGSWCNDGSGVTIKADN